MLVVSVNYFDVRYITNIIRCKGMYNIFFMYCVNEISKVHYIANKLSITLHIKGKQELAAFLFYILLNL